MIVERVTGVEPAALGLGSRDAALFLLLYISDYQRYPHGLTKPVYLLALDLHFWRFHAPCIELPFSGKKPPCTYIVIPHKVGQPGCLKDISFRLFLKSVEIPSVDTILSGKGLFTTNHLVCLKAVYRFKEPRYHFLTIVVLHKPFLFS